MIIKGLLTIVYNVLQFLLVFSLPSLPDSVSTILSQIMGYLVTGVSVLRVFLGNTCMQVLALLFALVLAMNAAYLLYSLVFWVIRKIPMLNVKE